jgi:hypothetical protein
VEVITAKTDYYIQAVPSARRGDNLVVKYILEYYSDTNKNQKLDPNEKSNPLTHIEIQPYAISWCGDGIKDAPSLGETWVAESCDGTDGVPAGKQCTTSCTLQDKPPVPQCGSSVGILSGPISSTSLNLCNPAPSLTGFTSSILGNKTSYSWSCNNISGNQSCSAEFTNPVC